MSGEIERPWILMRHHSGRTEVFHVQSETADAVTGGYAGREDEAPITYSARAVLARFPSPEAAEAARDGALAEWRRHDAAVRDAEARLREVEKARETAWLAWLRKAEAS